jgi:hypothetical protein
MADEEGMSMDYRHMDYRGRTWRGYRPGGLTLPSPLVREAMERILDGSPHPRPARGPLVSSELAELFGQLALSVEAPGV